MKNILRNITQDTPAKVSNIIKTLTGSVIDSLWPGKPTKE